VLGLLPTDLHLGHLDVAHRPEQGEQRPLHVLEQAGLLRDPVVDERDRGPRVEDERVRPLAVEFHLDRHVAGRQRLEGDDDRFGLLVRLRLRGVGAGGRSQSQDHGGEEDHCLFHGHSPSPALSFSLTSSPPLPRLTMTSTVSPADSLLMNRFRPSRPYTERPWNLTKRSPAFSPPWPAGPFSSTLLTTASSPSSVASRPRKPRGTASGSALRPRSFPNICMMLPMTSRPPCPPPLPPMPIGAFGTQSSFVQTILSWVKSISMRYWARML